MVILWWKLSSDESYLVMKIIFWWKLSSDESYQVMKVINWWKLSSDESYQMVWIRSEKAYNRNTKLILRNIANVKFINTSQDLAATLSM